jgi:hypothetical protein
MEEGWAEVPSLAGECHRAGDYLRGLGHRDGVPLPGLGRQYVLLRALPRFSGEKRRAGRPARPLSILNPSNRPRRFRRFA